MQRFGVSRPTLREAMRVLEGEALITVHRGARGGAHVHTPAGETVAQFAGLVLQFRGATVADVYEARRALDLAALRIIVGRGSLWDFVALDENVAAMDAPRSPGTSSSSTTSSTRCWWSSPATRPSSSSSR